MDNTFKSAVEAIEKRLGVPFEEYMKHPRTPEIQAKIDDALKRETEAISQKQN